MNEVQKQTTHSNTGSSGRIMLVDNNPDNLRVLKAMLEAHGYKTFAAINGGLALEALSEVQPELILLDIMMPEMDGYEVCRRLKADPDAMDIPVLFISALHEPVDKVKAFDVGGVDYISKPFEVEEVLARVNTHLELFQMRRHLEQRVVSRTRALQESEEKYRRLVEGLKDEYFFYSHNPDGIFSYLSPSIKQVLGYTQEEFMIHYAEYFTDNPINRQATENTERSLRGERQPAYEVEVFNKDGKKCWLEVKETPVLDNTGNVVAVEGISHDITEKKQQQEQLSRNKKMDALGKLTGGIAHDFNNVLGVILGYSEILQHKLSNEPKLNEYVGQIYNASERAIKLTSKLLAFSRKETTSAGLSDINSVIQGQQHLLETTLTARIKLVVKLAENLWPVWMDKASLEDAVLNMSINAMHAMPDGGVFTLETRNAHLDTEEAEQMGVESGDYVLLSLTDTGIGMDQATQQQIFDPFFSTKGDKGTGLGMSQVYGFVKQSRGVVRLYSELGQGTRFTIYFPRCVESSTVNSVQGEASVEKPTGNETILVVDDEPALREFNKEILTTHGYRVLCADGGEQALDILETETVDLLLTDVIMPVMDGYQLATKVKKYYPQIIIQVVSGFSEDYRVDLANEELHQQRLQKPINSDALLQRIRNLLDEKAKQAQDIEVKASTEFESLSSIEWSDQYSTGIHEIDTDHKALMALANRCLDAINSSEQRKEIRLILDELLDYTKSHFQREECIMKVCGYPDLTKHQQLHQILINEVEQKVKEYGLGNLTAKSLLEFLVNWLTDHVKGETKLMATCSKGKENLIEQALVDSGLNNQSSDS